MSCAIELKKHSVDPLIIEKANVVNSIYNFPTHQTFFSSSDKLEIGGVPFITEKQKPVRNQALSYYRTIADHKKLSINTYEKFNEMHGSLGAVIVTTETSTKQHMHQGEFVIIATSYYDQHNMMNISDEELPKVMHYFKEAHHYLKKKVVISGGKNSA